MITNMNHYKYKKYAVAVGDIVKHDTYTNYIHTNKQKLRKEYVKAYMKLLSK